MSEKDIENLNWVINVWNRLRRGGDAQTTPIQMEYLENWLKTLRPKKEGNLKVKAHELFTEYYKRLIHFNETADMDDINWLKTTLKSKDGEFDWNYGFSYDLYCDYDPSWVLYLILENAGIPDKHIRNICPWKTGISIRTEDNAVMYRTYQHCDEL